MLLVAYAAMWCVSCSDDDDPEIRGANGKKLISKVLIDKDNYITFDYDQRGELKKVTEYGRWADNNGQEQHSGSSIITQTYNRSGNKLVFEMEEISIDDETGDKETSIQKTTYYLNDKGLTVSFAFENEKPRELYKYDDKDQLISDGEFEYTWKDGNIIKQVSLNGTQEYTYTYSTNEKKTDICDISATNGEIFDYSYFGTLNKNLIISSKENDEENTFEYKFDKDGYVIEMREYSIENGKKTLGFTYFIEYK